MLNAMRAWNAWLALSSQAALPGLEAHGASTYATRRWRCFAESEASRIISMATLKRRNSGQVAGKVLRIYKKRVRRNRQRLTK
jgi:hypothetical protein